MTKEQLLALKQKQEEDQEDKLEGLIGTVKQMKTGQKAIGE
jgi:hypothetical protein